MKERVVVTGLGAITPIGNNIEEFWNGIKAGKTGFGKISCFDTTGQIIWISVWRAEWSFFANMR